MNSVTFETDGRNYKEQVNHPSRLEAAGFVEPALGSLRRAALAVFDALDIDGTGRHDDTFKVHLAVTKAGGAEVSVATVD